MDSRERVMRTLNREQTDRVPFGIFGTSDTNEARMAYDLGFSSITDMYKFLGIDIIHLMTPLKYMGEKRTYMGHEANFWGVPVKSKERGNSGDLCPLKNVSSVDEVEAYNWPRIEDFDSADYDRLLDTYEGFSIEGGLWAPIFHNLTWLCGFETALMNMVLQPEVTQAIIRHATDFWIDYCKVLLERARGRVDIIENCNDFGGQQGLMMSYEMFTRFFKPEFKRIYDTIKHYDVKVMQHSCGAISEVIGDYIDLGADIINPVQVSARGMEPTDLMSRFGGKVTFYGGIDTQHVLPQGPEELIRDVTRAALDTFGNSYILGPSQAIDDDIPTAHAVAMFDEGKKYFGL